MVCEDVNFLCLFGRFREVVVITKHRFKIWKEIEFETLSLDAIYAVYLVYKLPQDKSKFEAPMEIVNYGFIHDCPSDYPSDYPYIYLLNPPYTPFFGNKLNQNTQNPFNRPKLNATVPQKRNDGWMEVKLLKYKVTVSYNSIRLELLHPHHKGFSGLMIQGIEVRPIYISHDEESE